MKALKFILFAVLCMALAIPACAQDVMLVAEADHPTDVREIRWSDNGSELTIVDPDNAVRIVVGDDGQAANFSLSAKDASIYSADNDMNYVVAKSVADDTIAVYNISNPVDTRSIEPGYTVLSLDLAEDGSTLSVDNADAIGSTVYNLKDGSSIELTGFETAAPVYNTLISPDATHVLWHSRGTFQLQNISNGKMGKVISLWDFAAAYAISPDNKTIAVSIADQDDYNKGNIILFDAESGKEKCSVVVDAGVPGSIDYSADGSVINASDKTGLYTIEPESCTITQRKSVIEHAEGDTRILRVSVSPDGSAAAVLVNDGEIYIVNN